MRKRTKSHKSGSHSECPTPAARTASLPAGGRPEIINTSNSELRIESSPATLSNAPSPSIHLSDADIADHREFHDHAATEVNSRIYVKVDKKMSDKEKAVSCHALQTDMLEYYLKLTLIESFGELNENSIVKLKKKHRKQLGCDLLKVDTVK